MFLTFATTLVVMRTTFAVTTEITFSDEFSAATSSRITCSDYGEIDNAILRITENNTHQIVIVDCKEEYDLDGSKYISCIDGKWEHIARPQCTRRCLPPFNLKSGSLVIEGKKDKKGLFHKGTLAIYTCGKGFTLIPAESKYRVCEKGIWTGAEAFCEPTQKVYKCPLPKDISNGYIAQEQSRGFDHTERGHLEEAYLGQRLHYSCKPGYVLVGTPVRHCMSDSSWWPKIPPICSLAITEDPSGYSCPVAPSVPHSYTTLVQGYQSEDFAISGTEIQIHCISKFKNAKAPCQPGRLRCIGGEWVGNTPICVPTHECDRPPEVQYSLIFYMNSDSDAPAFWKTYPIKAQISYNCIPGYELRGSTFFSCSPGGCWLPAELPTCYPINGTAEGNRIIERGNVATAINAIVISGATGAGVLAMLLMICLITICRRKKLLTRAAPIAPPVQRADLNDHASLFHHPDRLALIAFADGMQNDQSSLPSYDEATRERGPSFSSNRLHRPHWPNLGVRRSRNTANPSDLVHTTRQGSFASHTPSTRSAGDSMGSTDTVAVSEGSTNVTLDTVSSYSGSQPASCRVHCGSLASFDTSSVVNTEGAPLLEENELEESHGGDNISLVVDNPSISDSASFKLSTNSAD